MSTSTPGIPEQNPGAQPPKKRRKWPWITAGIVAVLIAIGAATGGGGDSKSEPTAKPPAAADTATAPAEAPSADTPSQEPAAPTDWYATTYPVFEPVEQSGTGASVIPLPAGGTVGIVTATHDGGANFSVMGLDAANSPTGDLLVNTIGAYSGTTAYGLSGLGEPTSLKIEADGAWTIRISPVSTAPAVSLPASGQGDGVYLYDGEAVSPQIVHAGAANFIVIQYGESPFPNLAVNSIGAYTGTVPLTAGPSVITVVADGTWTIG